MSEKPDALREVRGHGVSCLEQPPDALEQGQVGLVQRLILGRPARCCGMRHSGPPSVLVSSSARSLARQRPRVGPILPCGMPSSAATT